MSKYFIAETKRIISKKSNIVTLFILFSIIFALDFVLFKGSNFNSSMMLTYGSESTKVTNSEFGTIFAILAFNAIFTTSVFMLLIFSSLVMGDENKERAYLRLSESGINRTRIVIDKYLLIVTLSFVILILALLVHFVNIIIIFGYSSEYIILLKEFFNIFIIYLLPFLNLLAFCEFLFLFITQEWLVGFLYVLWLFTPKVVNRLLSFANISNKQIVRLINCHPGSVISSLNVSTLSYTVSNIKIDTINLIPDLKLKLIVNALMTVFIIVLSIVLMRRRNFD